MDLHRKRKPGFFGRAAKMAFVAAIETSKIDYERDRLAGEYREGTNFAQQVSDLDIEAKDGEAQVPQSGPSEAEINRNGPRSVFRR